MMSPVNLVDLAQGELSLAGFDLDEASTWTSDCILVGELAALFQPVAYACNDVLENVRRAAIRTLVKQNLLYLIWPLIQESYKEEVFLTEKDIEKPHHNGMRSLLGISDSNLPANLRDHLDQHNNIIKLPGRRVMEEIYLADHESASSPASDVDVDPISQINALTPWRRKMRQAVEEIGIDRIKGMPYFQFGELLSEKWGIPFVSLQSSVMIGSRPSLSFLGDELMFVLTQADYDFLRNNPELDQDELKACRILGPGVYYREKDLVVLLWMSLSHGKILLTPNVYVFHEFCEFFAFAEGPPDLLMKLWHNHHSFDAVIETLRFAIRTGELDNIWHVWNESFRQASQAVDYPTVLREGWTQVLNDARQGQGDFASSPAVLDKDKVFRTHVIVEKSPNKTSWPDIQEFVRQHFLLPQARVFYSPDIRKTREVLQRAFQREFFELGKPFEGKQGLYRRISRRIPIVLNMSAFEPECLRAMMFVDVVFYHVLRGGGPGFIGIRSADPALADRVRVELSGATLTVTGAKVLRQSLNALIPQIMAHYWNFTKPGFMETLLGTSRSDYTEDLTRHWLEFLQRVKKQNPSARILEVGGGSLVLSLMAGGVSSTFGLTAVDIGGKSDASVREAVTFLDLNSLRRGNVDRIDFYQRPIEDSGLPSESVDDVIGMHAVEYADMPRALGELYRLMRPGARMKLVLHSAEEWWIDMVVRERRLKDEFLKVDFFGVVRRLLLTQDLKDREVFDDLMFYIKMRYPDDYYDLLYESGAETALQWRTEKGLKAALELLERCQRDVFMHEWIDRQLVQKAPCLEEQPLRRLFGAYGFDVICCRPLSIGSRVNQPQIIGWDLEAVKAGRDGRAVSSPAGSRFECFFPAEKDRENAVSVATRISRELQEKLLTSGWVTEGGTRGYCPENEIVLPCSEAMLNAMVHGKGGGVVVKELEDIGGIRRLEGVISDQGDGLDDPRRVLRVSLEAWALRRKSWKYWGGLWSIDTSIYPKSGLGFRNMVIYTPQVAVESRGKKYVKVGPALPYHAPDSQKICVESRLDFKEDGRSSVSCGTKVTFVWSLGLDNRLIFEDALQQDGAAGSSSPAAAPWQMRQNRPGRKCFIWQQMSGFPTVSSPARGQVRTTERRVMVSQKLNAPTGTNETKRARPFLSQLGVGSSAAVDTATFFFVPLWRGFVGTFLLGSPLLLAEAARCEEIADYGIESAIKKWIMILDFPRVVKAILSLEAEGVTEKQVEEEARAVLAQYTRQLHKRGYGIFGVIDARVIKMVWDANWYLSNYHVGHPLYRTAQADLKKYSRMLYVLLRVYEIESKYNEDMRAQRSALVGELFAAARREYGRSFARSSSPVLFGLRTSCPLRAGPETISRSCIMSCASSPASQNLPSKISGFFERHKLAMVFTAAAANAMGLVLMKLVASSTHPMQATFWVYLVDLVWVLLLFMPVLGSYKAVSGKVRDVYQETWHAFKQVVPIHKIYLVAYTIISLLGSCAIYYILPHVSSSMMLVFMQMSLLTGLPLSYKFLGERKGWARKLQAIGIISFSVAVMIFAEARVDPQFFAATHWIVSGVLVGCLYGIPTVLIRKIFKDVCARRDMPRTSSCGLPAFLPMVIMTVNYIFGVVLQAGLCAVQGVSLSVFEGVCILNAAVLLPVGGAAFCFVLSWFFCWKLSRMVTYDLSRILPGLSSTAMMAALISLGLYKIFNIGSVPFHSWISWVAPLGVIIGSFHAARDTAVRKAEITDKVSMSSSPLRASVHLSVAVRQRRKWQPAVDRLSRVIFSPVIDFHGHISGFGVDWRQKIQMREKDREALTVIRCSAVGDLWGELLIDKKTSLGLLLLGNCNSGKSSLAVKMCTEPSGEEAPWLLGGDDWLQALLIEDNLAVCAEPAKDLKVLRYRNRVVAVHKRLVIVPIIAFLRVAAKGRMTPVDIARFLSRERCFIPRCLSWKTSLQIVRDTRCIIVDTPREGFCRSLRAYDSAVALINTAWQEILSSGIPGGVSSPAVITGHKVTKSQGHTSQVNAFGQWPETAVLSPISRIDSILDSKEIRHEDAWAREHVLWELSELVLRVFDARTLRRVQEVLREKGSRYTCIGSRIDILFLDELLSSLIEKKSGFYGRFLARLHALFEIGSPENAIEDLGISFIRGRPCREIEKRRGRGIILRAGFDGIKQLQRAAPLLDGWYGSAGLLEYYIYGIPRTLKEARNHPPRSLILTATGVFWKEDFRGFRVPRSDESDTKPLLYEHTGRLRRGLKKDTFVRSSRRTLQSLGLLRREKGAHPGQQQIIIFAMAESHASTVAHVVPWFFFLHTHPITEGHPLTSSGGDLIYEASRADWQKRFLRNLERRLGCGAASSPAVSLADSSWLIAYGENGKTKERKDRKTEKREGRKTQKPENEKTGESPISQSPDSRILISRSPDPLFLSSSYEPRAMSDELSVVSSPAFWELPDGPGRDSCAWRSAEREGLFTDGDFDGRQAPVFVRVP